MSLGNMADPEDCRTVRQILDRVGDKWSLLVVATLAERPLRFNALRRAIDGVSQRMLTLTLRGLQRDGLVDRVAFATIPPRVDYSLTPLGRTLIGPVSALAGWAYENRAAIQRAQTAFDTVAERAMEDAA